MVMMSHYQLKKVDKTMKRIFVAGHKGMVGSAIVRQLYQDPNNQIITVDRKELDLVNQRSVSDYFASKKIDQVYLAAAKVGGIHANNEYPADFIYENLMIEANIINSAHKNNVQELLFLGSSCIYPKIAAQPMKEDALLTGALEPTNEPYAIAKIAGIKLCESYNRQYGRNYRSVMPTNLYGINDNFHSENSHVIPALIRRFHEAKLAKAPVVNAWGTGEPMREFLCVDDMAAASIFVMNLNEKIYKRETKLMLSHINVGTGVDCTIKELTEIIAKVVGYKGEIFWDKTKPDGAPRKLMDVSRIKDLGWKPKIKLEEGLIATYDWYLKNQDGFRN
jgi:GDP-L-fucose synthase